MKLTADNYYSREANVKYMSVSQFKAFQKCPACAMAEINGEYEQERTKALLVGSYIDAYFEGTLEKFSKETPEIFTQKGQLRAEFLQANEIIDRISRDKLFVSYMSGMKQEIMTGEICGVPVKIKIDSLHPDKIVDLKIMSSFDNVYCPDRGSLPWFVAWGYDLQGAVYQEVVRQNSGVTMPVYLAAATKEKVTDIDIVHLSERDLDVALSQFKADVERFNAMKKGVIPVERCEKCDYCKTTKVLTAPEIYEIKEAE